MSRKRPATSSSSSNNNNNMVFLLLQHLPLRPSTQQLLRTRGFATVQEVMESCRGKNHAGLSNFAAELGTSLQTAGGVWQEIMQLMVEQQQQQQQDDEQGNDNNNKNNNKTNQDNVAQKENHPQLNVTETTTAIATSNINNSSSSSSSSRSNINNSNNTNNNAIYYARNRPRTAQDILLSQQPFAVGNNNNNNNNFPTNHAVLTFCREIDQLLGGGIALGELTELAGLPGTGKTQWGMQLAVDCSLPVWIGGVCGQACYIDTEGSFCPERCHVLATALIQHIQRGMAKRQKNRNSSSSSSSSSSNNNNNMVWNVTADDILRGIHVIRVHDIADLQATLMGTLPRLAQERAQAGTPLRLVVVDSMAFPIRATVPPPVTSANAQQQQQQQHQGNNNNNSHVDFYIERNRQLTVAAQQLGQLASKYHLAAVAINQMTTKFVPTSCTAAAAAAATTSSSSSSSSNNNHHTTTTTTTRGTTMTSQMVPALGESWAHAVTTRILLSSSSITAAPYQVGNKNAAAAAPVVVVRRTCTLIKSPRLPTGSADYQVLECGIRGVNDHRPSSSSSARANG